MNIQPRLRAALLQGSMLIAPGLLAAGLLPADRAMAQSIPANARPLGGQVVGGSASIAQDAASTTINQTTNRAVIDWRSFDVGRDQLVQFQQPSASSMTLNRVTGPDPSVIAGRITANGGVALVNQSGVVFTGGAQVTAQSVIVSTADISNTAFMAGGRMAFDKPGKPGARIENNGTITAREAGLAALVAPQVANRGVIQAKLGTVVLAGAERHVIDLNGDGLVSFDVTDAVRTQPAGGEALVTNTGTISARGGTVLLTAAAADGIVQNLVRAGGTIDAATDAATGRTGQVLLTGTGGSIRVEGTIDATGSAADTAGGTIAVVADRVLVAAPAVLDASGKAGGGTIAVGTTLPGAKVRRLADRTGIEAGAVLRADATARGNGGRIIVNSNSATAQAGHLSARGGPAGGNGGTIEISSGGGLLLGGTMDTGAPAGLAGQVILDPQFLTVVADTDPSINVGSADIASLTLGFAATPTNAFIGAGLINGVTGNLVLQATDTLTVAAAIDKPLGDLSLQTNGTLTLNAPVVLGAGNLVLSGPTIALNDLVQVGAAQQVAVDTAGVIGTTSLSEAGNGRIVAGILVQTGTYGFGDITLDGLNQVGRIDGMNAYGVLSFTNGPSLLINGTVNGSTSVAIDVLAGDLTIGAVVHSYGGTDSVRLRASGNIVLNGTNSVTGGGITMDAGFDFANGTVDPASPGGITLAGYVLSQWDGGSSPIALGAGTGGIQQTGGMLQGTTLTVQSGGNAVLPGSTTDYYSGNEIDVLGPSDVAGNFSLTAYKLSSFGSIGLGGDLQLSGDIRTGGTLALQSVDTGMAEVAGARILAARLDASAIGAGGYIDFSGDNQVATLGTVSAYGVTYRNVSGLDILGPVTSAGTIGVAVANGDLAVDGPVTSSYGDIGLTAAGNLAVNASGTILAQGLDGGGVITLQAASPDSGFASTLPGGMSLAGTIDGLQVYLAAGTGGIAQTGGQLLTGDLAVVSGAAALLNGASPGTPNSVTGSLLGAIAAGDFALDNGTTPLTVTGAVTAANIDLATTALLTLSGACAPASATCIIVPATLDAGAGTVSLRPGSLLFAYPGNHVTGGIVEIAPRDNAGLIAGDIAGSSVPGALSVNQDVLAQITAQTLRLGGTTPGGTTATTVQLVGPINLGGTLDLRSLGTVSQTAAAPLAIGTLTGNAGGAVLLGDGSNAIGTVGDLAAGGGVTLAVGGAMTLAGLLSAPGQTVNLGAANGIAETGGRIAAGVLAAQTTAGDIALTGPNLVDTLAAAISPGNITFNDNASALAIPAGAAVQAGGAASVTSAGNLTLGGTASAKGLLQLAAANISSGGLLSSPTGIVINAGAAAIGGQATGPAMAINAPGITLTGLNAAGTTVTLGLGTAGNATGSLDVAGLVVAGGRGAGLTGSLAGVGGGPAAALGVRADAAGVPFGSPPPSPNSFLLNGCPIAVSVCLPMLVPPPTVAVNPTGFTNGLRPGRFAGLTDTWFGLPVPIDVNLLVPTTRDRAEHLDLAPPNVRAEDF